jgi:hypothetical protein
MRTIRHRRPDNERIMSIGLTPSGLFVERWQSVAIVRGLRIVLSAGTRIGLNAWNASICMPTGSRGLAVPLKDLPGTYPIEYWSSVAILLIGDNFHRPDELR